MHVAPREDGLSWAAGEIVDAARSFWARGWALGTGGNFSVRIERDPLRLALSPTGADKGRLELDDVVEVDEAGRALRGRGRPSAETAIHLAIVRARDAGAVFHTHSVWGTLASERFAGEGGLAIAGYEMLKGLRGVGTHEHREWLPVVDNSQDVPALARSVGTLLAERPDVHGFLVRGHGLYTWGEDPAEARRHVEILEFLLEVVGRS
jgi:methylthioribulose-1-phosphate dehydratase